MSSLFRRKTNRDSARRMRLLRKQQHDNLQQEVIAKKPYLLNLKSKLQPKILQQAESTSWALIMARLVCLWSVRKNSLLFLSSSLTSLTYHLTFFLVKSECQLNRATTLRYCPASSATCLIVLGKSLKVIANVSLSNTPYKGDFMNKLIMGEKSKNMLICMYKELLLSVELMWMQAQQWFTLSINMIDIPYLLSGS